MNATEQKCRVCGCTEAKACVKEGVACHWVEPDLCSHCAPTPRMELQQLVTQLAAHFHSNVYLIVDPGPGDEEFIEMVSMSIQSKKRPLPEFFRKLADTLEKGGDGVDLIKVPTQTMPDPEGDKP